MATGVGEIWPGIGNWRHNRDTYKYCFGFHFRFDCHAAVTEKCNWFKRYFGLSGEYKDGIFGVIYWGFSNKRVVHQWIWALS